MFFWYFLFAITAFLQTAVMPFDLLLLLVISLSCLEKSPKILLLFFFAGLLNDLITLRVLGQSSVFYLLIGFIIMLYGQKFRSHNPLFILTVTIFSAILENWLQNAGFSPGLVIMEAIAVLPVFYLTRLLFENTQRRNSKQLKLKL
ncbi:MAG: hypothetical protein M1120_03035 [Patescibacteria group bacterium]|nr:hypothetical protein [Patescibacteria group bacterium]